jgi:hypothetical protein
VKGVLAEIDTDHVMCMTMILLLKLPSYATRRRTISLIQIAGSKR